MRRGISTRAADALAIVAAALVVGLPAIVTHDGFIYDFTNHFWLVWVQGHEVSAGLAPTYFLHTDNGGGVFDPFFMFYGGTLYALAGGLTAVLGGSARIAYVGVILGSVVAAYGGTLWLARRLGAHSWPAHAPAVTFVASAYYVTNVYGRGAWPEFVAVSAIPLLIAAGVSIARAPRVRALPWALFVAAAIVWTGSHNITLAWGAAVSAATLVLLRVLLGRPLAVSRGRLGALLGSLALAVCVNAWFLVPNVLYAADTQIAAFMEVPWSNSAQFNEPSTLFHPGRHAPQVGAAPAIFVQLPMWMLAWTLVTFAALRARTPPALRRAAAGCAIVFASLLLVVMVEPLWELVPEPWRLIQFAYRLQSLVTLLAAGLVLVAVLALQDLQAARMRRALAGGLAGAMGVSIGLCLWQLWIPETHYGLSYADLRHALQSDRVAPRTWYNGNAYLDASAPIVAVDRGRLLRIEPGAVSGNSATLTLTPPPGREPFAVNLGAGPGVVDVDGVERVGRTKEGFLVARRPDGGRGPLRVTIRPAAVPRAAQVVSLLAICVIVVLPLAAALSRRRARSPLTAGSAR